jgi:hypothetical protein
MTTSQQNAGKARKVSASTKVASAARQVAVKPKPEIMKPHEVVTSSTTLNAAGIASWGKFAGDVDLQELVNELGEQTVKVQDGDMRPIEGMLFRQAKTLETMFVNLARRAANQEHLKQFQTHLTLALKAQAQCRATLEALAEIKNPRPVQFVKQANMTTGPQQVNNGVPNAARTEKFESEPNKLLEADHEQRMDLGAQGAASRVNQTMEAVG